MQFNSPQDLVNDQLSTVTIVNATPGNGVRATQIGLFVNDKFQVLPTLSVDLGLRYDIETVPHDSRYATRPYDTRTGTLGPPGDPYFAINNKDFGPRVGIAWSPTQRLVIRSGYGIYFQDYPVGFGCTMFPETPCRATSRFYSSRFRTCPIPMIRSSRRHASATERERLPVA